jgi:hypothetical protein
VDGTPKHSSHREGHSAKTIFFVSLSTSIPIEKTISTLQGLRESRSIPLFSIGGAKQGTPSATIQKTNPQVSQISSPVLLTPSKSNQETLPSNEPSRLAIKNSDVEEDDDSFPEIDQLMLDLDRFEL